jgi:hypothetical protein
MVSVSPTATPTEVRVLGPVKPEELLKECPKEDSLFSLWYSHYAAIDIGEEGGETFNLKFENIPPSFFDLWIYADGTISNEGIIREAPIAYNGTANHPGSDDCPVQTFEGTWMMKATITGTCEKDIARIYIKEEWIDPVLVSDCTGPLSPGEGLFSAPELDLVFDLNDIYPADFVEGPSGGPFEASYGYHLWPAGYDLPIVPLVPERE